MGDDITTNKFVAKWQEHLAQTIGGTFYMNDSPRYATFTHPGFSADDTDRYGNPTVANIIRLSGSAFTFGMSYPYQKDGHIQQLLQWGRLHKDRLVFMGTVAVHCSRAVYDGDIAKWALDAKVSFGGMGSSSFRMATSFFLQGSKKPLFTRYIKLVTLDKTTRRPAPLPDWFRTSYQQCEDAVPDLKFVQFQRPPKTFVCRLMVVHSDTDFNNHAGYTTYMRFGLDAIHLALYKKAKAEKETQSGSDTTKKRLPSQDNTSAIKWLTEDNLKQGVKRLEIGYVNETLEGEEVNVHVWQEEDAKFVVKCSIEAVNRDTVLSQFMVEYFTPPTLL